MVEVKDTPKEKPYEEYKELGGYDRVVVEANKDPLPHIEGGHIGQWVLCVECLDRS